MTAAMFGKLVDARAAQENVQDLGDHMDIGTRYLDLSAGQLFCLCSTET